MGACPSCKTAMKPLFTGEYCPNECDLPAERRTKKAPDRNALDALAKEIDEALKKMATPAAWVPVFPMGFPPLGNTGFAPPKRNVYTPASGQCRKASCRGKGMHVSAMYDQHNHKTHDYYECSVCGAGWSEYVQPAAQPTQGTFTIN